MEQKMTASSFTYALILALIFIPFFVDTYAADTLRKFVDHDLSHGLLMGLILTCLIIFFLIFGVIKKQSLQWASLGLKKMHTSQWLFVFKWTLINIFLGILYVVLLELTGIGSSNTKTESLQNEGIMMFVLAFLSAAVLSPIYEELFYRGFIYTWLRQRLTLYPSLIISAAIFTLVHIPTYNTLPINFISGIIFAWVYERTGSIISSMIVHASFNGLAVILTFLLG
ncbi:CPBP family intramembrane glutamic endopeptidase [Jeotgalibacillus sp. R-1-5s-1]|uniref:CPBP family intramembrane glutamic endopeptidase n=1 Tax=Jeotgalibacillus sp. R-1-5s-1 TaxID=2555897 RepID=UPI00106AB3F7|nr:type II CAAX endopeptidase family protein [Jeotgalibacillus sp. R-1-5s-1]TFE00777.1 CPBP family intramembrane metalloprotease [Jeotgalibacillus sp. R-1-5s-1]